MSRSRAIIFDLFAWLQELGDELGFVVVKHFTIKQAATTASDNLITARLTIVSYREAGDA